MEHPLAPRRLTEIACAAALVLAGLASLVPELRAATSNLPPDPGLAATDLAPGLSLASRQNALFRCDRAMAEPGFALLGDLTRQATARACADLAVRVLRDAPSHGFAHFIASTAARAQHDTALVAAHLAASQRLAPFEGWLAERRFLMTLQTGPDAQRDLLPADVAALMTTQAGAEMLAAALSSPQRDIILMTAERSSPADRQRLLNILRRQAGGT